MFSLTADVCINTYGRLSVLTSSLLAPSSSERCPDSAAAPLASHTAASANTERKKTFYFDPSRESGVSDRRLSRRPHVLARRTEPLSVWDQHERRPQTGRVIAAVTGVAQEDLKPINT